MSIIENIQYEDDNLLAGNTISAYKDAPAGTYYRGQVLGRVTASNLYQAFNAGGADGTEKLRAVCAKDTVLAAQGKLPTYISGTEVMDIGLKDENGDALTVTTAIIENAQDQNIIIKEV